MLFKSHRHINSLRIENRHVCRRKVANVGNALKHARHNELPPNLNQYLDTTLR